jgi:hypothetical protein
MATINRLGGSYQTQAATGWRTYFNSQAQDVVTVDLADCDSPDTYLPEVAGLPSLRTLVVGGQKFGDQQLGTLRPLASLQGLILDSTCVTDAAVAALQQARPHLVVYKSPRRAIAELEKLGAIIKDVAPGVAPPQLSKPPTWLLETAGDEYFVDPPPWGVNLAEERIADADLAWLATLVCVRDITLEATGISDDGLAHLCGLAELQYLNISRTRVTDAGLKRLGQLPQLIVLEARKTRLGDSGLETAANWPLITELDLADTQVTDAGLAYLKDCQGLHWLWLQGTRVTDQGLAHLHALKALQGVSFHRTQVTDNARLRLRDALPGCVTRF